MNQYRSSAITPVDAGFDCPFAQAQNGNAMDKYQLETILENYFQKFGIEEIAMSGKCCDQTVYLSSLAWRRLVERWPQWKKVLAPHACQSGMKISQTCPSPLWLEVCRYDSWQAGQLLEFALTESLTNDIVEFRTLILPPSEDSSMPERIAKNETEIRSFLQNVGRRLWVLSSDRPACLTRRESECLALVAEGMTSKQVARSFGISPKTVDFHIGNAMRRANAATRSALVAKYARSTINLE